MPKAIRFTQAELADIRNLSSRKAAAKYKVGFALWRKIKDNPDFQPSRHARDPREVAAVVARVLESVKSLPHLNTQARARQLDLGTQRVQEVLVEHGLSNLNSRLRFAGYQVEVVRPLQVARLRRIVATRPGSLTHIDYKTFGFLRGTAGCKGRRLGGYVVVDSLTGFARLLLSERAGPEEACAALEKYRSSVPFDLKGIIFSDNDPTDFLSDTFMRFVGDNGWMQRTTKYNSPWSNGKVEAVNKTLKYQCFPAIAAANVELWQEVEQLVDKWMDYYNDHRAHSGHVNKGLPPRVLYELWQSSPGNHLEKLVHLGVISLDTEWELRMMGDQPGNGGDRPGGHTATTPLTDGRGVPYALVLEKRRNGQFSTQNGDVSHTRVTLPRRRVAGAHKRNLILAK